MARDPFDDDEERDAQARVRSHGLADAEIRKRRQLAAELEREISTPLCSPESTKGDTTK